MSNTDTGPAFPQPAGVAADGTTFFYGMTLRDYFAAKAMQVFLKNKDSTTTHDATAAYLMADEMMKARDA